MGDGQTDKRLAWLGSRVCTTLKLKDDTWKGITNGDSKKDVESFLNKDSIMRLLIYAENGRDYVAGNHPPQKYKKKAMYFIKREACVLTPENMQDSVLYGDSSETPLESLSSITKHVFLPLLTCADNQDGWPDFLTKELSESLHKFTANLFVAIGQMQGRTMLPLPADIDSLDPENLATIEDHDRIHILESCVVTWTKQIKNVLKSDPDEPLKQGLHVGPETELNFWTERANNLNSVEQQLLSDNVQKIVTVLKLAHSTYHPAYLRLADEVAKAKARANDNVKFLAPLKPRLEKVLYRDEFNEISGLFKPVFHTLMLIWKHSVYYAQPTRIVTLVREICNSLIEKAMAAGEGLHQKEPQEAVDTLRMIMRVLGTFKSFYFDYKSQLADEAPERQWKVQNSTLFGRLDEFMERVHDVLEINLTCLQFSKLGGERGIEIGGTKGTFQVKYVAMSALAEISSIKLVLILIVIFLEHSSGKLLSQGVRDIYDEFVATMEKWHHIEYDIIDIGADTFSTDYSSFRAVMRELDRRLCQVVLTAFDDCATMTATFKLLDSFEGLLDREVISQALEAKHMQLLLNYSDELASVKDAFHYTRDTPVLPKNAARHSGAIKWVRGLVERIEAPMDKIRALNKLVLETEEARRTLAEHTALVQAMKEFEEEHAKAWVSQVSQTSTEKLALKLLKMDPHNTTDLHLLAVNFDPQLVNLLRETKYFLSLGVEVPTEACSVFERSKTFRRHIGALELLVAVWNRIQRTILPVEFPLVRQQIEDVRARLDEGLKTLDWNSPTIDKYLDEVKVMMDKVDDILRELKRNVDGTRKVLQQWEENLLFERKADRTYSFADLREEFDKSVSARHAVINDNGKAIGKNVSSSYRTLVVRPEPADWKAYTDYVSNIVIDGFARGIVASLDYLTGQLLAPDKPDAETPPLVEVQMLLQSNEICWRPDLDDGGDDEGGSVLHMFRQWSKRYLATGDLMKRLDVGEGTYGREIEEDYDVMFAFSALQDAVLQNGERCAAFAAEFTVYEDLWKKDMKESLSIWLTEKTTKAPETGVDVPPSLKDFDEEIQRYKAMEKSMRALMTSKDIGWVRVDAQPLKKSLESLVSKWSYLYIKYLQDKVVNEMEELYAFTRTANQVLDLRVGDEGELGEAGEDDDAEVLEGEELAAKRQEQEETARKNLYNIMGAMRDIRVRDERTQTMFQPLKETVALLKGYGVPVRDETVNQLEDGPMNWKALDKKKKQRVEALNAKVIAEQLEVRRRSDAFQKNVDSFSEHFQATAPFHVKNGELTLDQVKPAYEIIDAFHHKKVPGFDVKGFDNLEVIARDAKQLQEEQDLFDLNVSSYLKLQRCGEQLGYLKSCWDWVGGVMYTFTEWYKTPWDRIDVDFLSEETKKLQKDIKSLNKAVRNYEVYRLMEEKLKAMSTSLPLIGDLAHPAMRDRHWEQLMRATGKTFVKDDKFSLGDLLALGLHNYVDDCSEIVDRAQKELNIEKQLEKIDTTWGGLYLSFSQYQDTDVFQMNADDAITEALETDNLTLQNMSAGKYVQGNEKFKQLVNDWQTKLGTVEAVLGCWGDVQKKWQALESIFIGSADIRVQLPEDSKRFDAINADFQDLMRSAPDVTGVVEACNLEGRDERLNNLLSQLEMCEKALQDYLETKRIAFPRFYFVAPADLLDILSKGSNPQLILRHLSKCFDSVCNMEFRLNDKGEPTKAALAMFDPKGEKVLFDGECSCDGPVEQWLNSVVDAMKQALFAEYVKAIPAYDNMKRSTEWIYEFSAQNTIVVSRTFFTQEVNEAFEELEEGNEDALKIEWEKQKSQLADLVVEINKPLKSLDRATLITLCTIDVHARDVLGRLIDERVEDVTCFQWQSQLRYVVHEKTKKCQVNICDAEIAYNYEYIGNCGCLCITPLTDRCYITLTQAQRLVLGGAPAGPAGTGKTESTKDLARALGVQCYVFNCSDQMDYKAMGQIYKGLAQTGAWGCFDEFNRIPVAVLSVCSTQYKTVLDAIRARKEVFAFEEVEIKLLPTVMAFITMNPGYPGRAELPESLKALFRPVSMVLPDLALICEIMLMAEGFQMSKLLSRKFVILYKLCEDLLSKARHYDWKLRAIKTTLYVAGGMKRDAPELTEDKVLLRALRDFNLGKLTSDDTGIFVGLLNDLFPRTLELVPRAIDQVFETQCRKSARELQFQPDDMFCLKISQLREILVVRWSVFLLGPAGCGKTAIWKTLRHAQLELGEKTVFKPVNPKAVTRNELYGYLHPATREWKEGLMSVTFRNFANDSVPKHQWIVLDGDIDAEWIESMNTVMDDNKMLTLASNERIPLTGSMRLLLEINHMNHCSPATVSRGGVIFVNAEDVGWRPVVDSWMESLEVTDYKPLLAALFDKYVESTMEYCRRNFKYVVQLPAVAQAQIVCKILDGILPKEQVRNAPPPDKKKLEHDFVFACVWAFGGAMFQDKVSDYRKAFSMWWQSEWKAVPFPEKGLVYDYYVKTDDEGNVSMAPWEDIVDSFTYSPDETFGNMFVNTVETTRMKYFLNSFVGNRHYCMFVGNTGTSKTAIMMNVLRNMDQETMSSYVINMNSFSDAPSLQPTLESPLEKKSGVRFGPPGAKNLVYFIDDMNMPFVDKYDTQSAIEIVRQYVDYGGWYDKVKIVLKDIVNCQLMGAMNPTAGSFQITPRMQRHFVTFGIVMPGPEIVRSIYYQMISGHLASFEPDVARMSGKLTDATIDLHKTVMNNFLPSSVKFHYQFNLREMSNITQGLLQMTTDMYKVPLKVIRLWKHECERVFRDRLVNQTDLDKYDEFLVATLKSWFKEEPQDQIQAAPNLFTSFIDATADDTPLYNQVASYEVLKKILEDKLAEYNDSNAVMNLVLFQQAMEHVCRIARIIALPRGNAMLVGVGGSGKQSLARLASFICGYDVFQIAVSSTYGVGDFKENLLQLYTKAGMKGQPVTFLLTDNQIVNERFLVFLNDLLATGMVADVFAAEDIENFSNSVRNEVKAAGILETPENLWEFFIEKIRRNLHVVLCFSPVGDKFRIRARQFPALVNCTAFDWFHGWPHEALVSVANRFLVEIPDIDDEVRGNIASHMAFVHTEVTSASVQYLEAVRRFCYTTPKSYLELISLYKTLLARKRENLQSAKDRLVSGVEKIAQASAQVEDLQKNLVEEQKIVAEKKEKTGALIEAIGKEKVQVDAAVEAGREDEEAAAGIKAEVEAFQAECAKDLEAAEPIIAEAEAALNSLDKASLGELKSFGSPAAEVVAVVSACMILTAAAGKIPKDVSWNAGKKSMGNVDAFLKSLINFDKDNVPEKNVETCEKEYLSNPNFNPDYIRSKSGAAAGLCGWVVNICKYFRIYQVVAPKRAMLQEANAKLAGAEKKLGGIRARVADLKAKVEALETNLMKATEDKNQAVAQAEKTETKAKLADRLINGLSGENKRWNETIKVFDVQAGRLVGDVLLASSFVSYCGPFNMAFRVDLVGEKWLKDLIERKVPMTEGVQPLDQLTSDTEKAQWGNEGLPTDPLSIENGAIMMNSSRTTLMIDPQLQGIRWVINREEANGLTIIQQSQKGYIDKVIACIENGRPLLIENLPDDIDAVLDSVVGKQTMKRGQNLVIKIGDNEVDYDKNFRLYLQTKLANPHYKPEINAQTTLVNFCVTEKGLEDQLLAQVVEHERPDLQEQAQELVKQLGEFTITLKNLEDNLLTRLANSQGDILEDIELIENLEETKRTALDIEEKVKLAKETEIKISGAREVYRPVATRGSLMYFLIDNINTLDRVYHYSMANFVFILRKGMDVTPGGPDESKVAPAKRLEEEVPLEQRVKLLIDTTSYEIFQYVAQGLFERHKLIVATQLCIAILRQSGKLQADKLEFLLKGPRAQGQDNPLKEFVTDAVWACVMALRELEDYSTLPDDLQGSAKRWREWMELERPEDEPLPGDWKRMSDFDQLLLFRALRPDRLTSAMARFCATVIDPAFTRSVPFDLERSFEDAAAHVPMFVFLSPGVDVAAAVEGLGRKLGYTADSGKYVSVSLGQGQEPIAMNHLNNFHRNGGWVLLQNIHLTIDWTSGPLEKKVDKLAEGAHPDFRLFLSAEPPPGLERPLPISLLQNSIKLTNEPPQGLQANLIRSWNNFNEEILEGCAKQGEFRTIVFGLCYFHACLLERKKFGVGNIPGATSGIGWNMNYPFNTGDLLCCGQTAHNYLENNVKVPWDDLVYIFGEIMYGGHIVEDWDRRLANAYLFKYFNEALLEGLEYFPGFVAPPTSMSHKQVVEYLMEMPGETPVAFGFHPNAEIGFKLREGDAFCSSLILMQPRDAGEGGGASEEEKARTVLEDIVERLPEAYDMEDIRARVEDFSPYTMVAIQESERMNVLTAEMKRSLAELELGLRGDLTMSEPMEKLMRSLASDAVPASWRNLAYPSLRSLGSWLVNVQARAGQLNEWTADLSVPKVVWLSGLFNPQSFLTAVMQTTARRNDWPLDKTVIVTEVTKKLPDQVEQPSRDGAFIHGLTLEGARWDDKAGVLDDSKPKELFYQMPVIMVKAVTVDRAEMKDAYQCPVYATEARFREEIFTAQLKSKATWIKWTLAGVCMFLDVV